MWRGPHISSSHATSPSQGMVQRGQHHNRWRQNFLNSVLRKVSFDLLTRSSSHASTFDTVVNYVSYQSIAINDPDAWISYFLQCCPSSTRSYSFVTISDNQQGNATVLWKNDWMFIFQIKRWFLKSSTNPNKAISIDKWLQLLQGFALQWVAFFLWCILRDDFDILIKYLLLH